MQVKSGTPIPRIVTDKLTSEYDLEIYGVGPRWQQPLSQDVHIRGKAGVGYLLPDQEEVGTSCVVNPVGARTLVSRTKKNDSYGEPCGRLGRMNQARHEGYRNAHREFRHRCYAPLRWHGFASRSTYVDDALVVPRAL